MKVSPHPLPFSHSGRGEIDSLEFGFFNFLSQNVACTHRIYQI